MAAHDSKERAREKAGWGLPVPEPAGTLGGERAVDDRLAPPKAAAGQSDPVASLFQGDQALPAPSIAEQPSEAEITRFRTAGHVSLFDESVPDPAPLPPNKVHAVRAVSRATAMSVPPPVPAARKTARAIASEPPLSGSPSMAPLVAAVMTSFAPPGAEAPTRKRRIARGPKKGVLAAVGIAAALSLGSAAAVLRMIPNPIAPASDRDASAPPLRAHVAPTPAPRPAPPPMAVPVHAFMPAPLPAPPPPVVAAPPPAAVPVAARPVAAAVPVTAVKVEATQDDTAEATSSGAENQRLVAAANKKLAEDDPNGAETLMREALARDPNDHHAMEVLVRALIDQDRGADAASYARKMVKRRSKRVPYRLLLGDALLMTGDENGARREWKAALDLEPHDRQVRLRLGL